MVLRIGDRQGGGTGGDLDQPGYELLCLRARISRLCMYELGMMVPENESLRDRNRSFLLESEQRAPFLVDERREGPQVVDQSLNREL